MTNRGETLHSQPWTFLRWLRKRVDTAVAIEIVLIALLFVIGFIVSTYFRTIDNLVNIIEQSTGLAFVALGQTVVILSGGIDLSLDATIALTSSLLSGAVNGRAELAAPMIAAVLAIGLAIGHITLDSSKMRSDPRDPRRQPDWFFIPHRAAIHAVARTTYNESEKALMSLSLQTFLRGIEAD